MKQMTKANLEAAFAGESQAHMKYSIFADKAEREGYVEVARLFRAIAFAEKVHALAAPASLRNGAGATARQARLPQENPRHGLAHRHRRDPAGCIASSRTAVRFRPEEVPGVGEERF